MKKIRSATHSQVGRSASVSGTGESHARSANGRGSPLVRSATGVHDLVRLLEHAELLRRAGGPENPALRGTLERIETSLERLNAVFSRERP